MPVRCLVAGGLSGDGLRGVRRLASKMCACRATGLPAAPNTPCAASAHLLFRDQRHGPVDFPQPQLHAVAQRQTRPAAEG